MTWMSHFIRPILSLGEMPLANRLPWADHLNVRIVGGTA
jgi:hypothetical protein